MLHYHHQSSSVLVTTPDYPPKRGGLSTFTLNIEKVLKEMNVEYDLFVWNGPKEIKEHKKIIEQKYKHIIHVHCLTQQLCSSRKGQKSIVFFHGSEILFRGRNHLFTFIKKLSKPFALRKMESAFLNISISDFTLKKLSQQGYRISYDRDLVVHNSISLHRDSKRVINSLNDETIRFICVARSVPHKNPEGVKKLVMSASQVLNKKIELYSCFDIEGNAHFDHHNIDGISNENLKSLYQRCHFNLLLSLDHSHRGFYEGFGLTVLEAGQWGVPSIVSPFGGLPEACHNGITGWVLALNSRSFSKFFEKISEQSYQEVCEEVYRHTHRSHNLSLYQKIFKKILIADAATGRKD